MSVSELTNKICNMNLVSVNTIDQKIDEQRTINGLVVISKTLESLAISQNIMHMIESWKQGKLRKELIRNEQTQTNEDIQRTLSSLPSEIVHEIPSETLAEAFQSNNQRKPEEIDDVMKYVDENSLATLESGASSTTIDISDNINVEENLDFQQNTEDLQSENDTLLTKTDIENMHFSLKRSKNSKKKWEMPSTEFLLLFSSATEINKRFTKQELLDMLAPVAGKLASNGIKVLASETKRKLIEKICPILGDGSTLPDPPKEQEEVQNHYVHRHEVLLINSQKTFYALYMRRIYVKGNTSHGHILTLLVNILTWKESPISGNGTPCPSSISAQEITFS